MPVKEKKKGFSLQGFDVSHYQQTEAYVQAIDQLYAKAVQEFALLAIKTDINPNKMFSFSDYPSTRAKAESIIGELAAKMKGVIVNGSRNQWLYACKKNDEFIGHILNTSQVPKKTLQKWQDQNLEALSSFQTRKVAGMDLSKRIWNYAGQMKTQMELGIDIALGEGNSAQVLSKELRQYLVDPDKLFRRVHDKHGNLKLSKAAAAYHPGQGKYRSSYKNAMRLTRSEINMAYRTADQLRWQKLDFVVGFEIKLSNNHTLNGEPFVDICDKLAGKYPKSFVFKGWHPQCYSDDTEVMTNKGWKLFKNLLSDDLIMSLNPETRNTEYVNFITSFSYPVNGEMVRFSNRSLDMLVTPDHKMVYLKKSDGSIATDKQAADYSKFNGGLYRSAEHDAEDVATITIGKHTIEFDLFVQFMAYYLAEGSISWTRKNQLSIAQSKEKHPENYSNIEALLSCLPFKFTPLCERFYIYDPDMCKYLKQFGKSPEKHVPEIIKNASKRQIGLFIDAYVQCDGHSRKNKPFIGNRGNVFIPNNQERIFFTSSDQMACDIGELLLKIGKRPSFSLDKIEGVAQNHKNGTYFGNKDLWRIRECHSETATVFNKELVYYSGMVYDVELERNHIMYVRRNGKCVWGSNCRCHAVPILMEQEEFNADELNELKAALKGTEYKKFSSKNTVRDVPDNFKGWVAENAERSKGWKSQPYFIRDNYNGGTLAGGLKVAQIGKKAAPIQKIARPIVPNTIEDAKTELKSIFESGSNIKVKSVFYHDSFTVESANKANSQVKKLFDEYEISKIYNQNSMTDVKFKSGADYYGRVSGMNDNTILTEINFGHKSDLTRIEFTGKYRPKSKIDPENIDFATITHEFAHLITVDRQQIRSYIDSRLTDFMPELRSIKSRYTRHVNMLAKAGKDKELNEIFLGNYASTNINEFMAEAFTEYKLSSNPSQYAKEVGELIDKVFKRKKE